jgi:hypothetical protein
LFVEPDIYFKQTVDIYSSYSTGALGAMVWIQRLVKNTDLALGLALSVVLGSVVGLTMSHPLGHLLFGSALGVILLVIYVGSYSWGAIWMMGAQQGLLVVSAFIWCVILSSWLAPHPHVPSIMSMF